MNKTPTVSAPSPSLMSASPPADTTVVKTEGKKRRRTADPVDREAKARERTLRNRAAAQLSREKKRRYVEELESTNTQLKRDNASLVGRLSGVEADNCQLTRKLEAVTLQLSAMQNQMSFLASLATCRNSAATTALPLAQPMLPSSPASLGTPTLCSDNGSDIDPDGKADEALHGDGESSVDFGESAALDKLAPEIDSRLLMSILADSLGPSYPFVVSPPSLQEDNPMSAAALFPAIDRQGKRPEARAPEKKPSGHDEALLSDNEADGPLDPFSGLVDFELFEQAMQSPEDDTSRNNQAPADFDADVLLSSYQQQLLDAQILSTPAPFHPVF